MINAGEVSVRKHMEGGSRWEYKIKVDLEGDNSIAVNNNNNNNNNNNMWDEWAGSV
jgi:hypothetical protein